MVLGLSVFGERIPLHAGGFGLDDGPLIVHDDRAVAPICKGSLVGVAEAPSLTESDQPGDETGSMGEHEVAGRRLSRLLVTHSVPPNCQCIQTPWRFQSEYLATNCRIAIW